MKKQLHLFLIATTFASLAQLSNAAVFAGTFNFTGATGNVASLAYNGASIPDVTIGNLSKVGVTTSASSDNSRATGWPTGATNASNTFSGTINLSNYFEFTLTAADGYTIDMTSIGFGIGRSGTGPRQWEWRTSIDSYAATVSTYSALNAGLSNTGGILTNPDLNSSWTGNVLNLSAAAYKDLTSITFRFYGYNSEASGGTGGFQGNLSFAGEAIPEPSAALLGGLGLLALLRRRR